MDASKPGRPRPRLGRLAAVFGVFGVVAYGAAALIHWKAFGTPGSARYSTEPMIDWFTIVLTAGPILIVTAGACFVTALVLALIVLVRWAVARRPARAR
jgi:hypothetical protein